MNLIPLFTTFLIVALFGRATGEEVVIHRGRVLQTATSFGKGPAHQEIHYAERTLMDRQPTVDLRAANPPLSIPEAAANVAKHKKLERVVVLQAKLNNYSWEAGGKKGSLLQGVLFYTLELFTLSSIDEFVVLMDGTVIEPRREPMKADK